MNNKLLKNIYKIFIIIIIIYLFISSLYILVHIDFKRTTQTPQIDLPAFRESTNMVRIFMGLPKTYSTYEGVSTIYLISVATRFIVAIVLIIIIKKHFNKLK